MHKPFMTGLYTADARYGSEADIYASEADIEICITAKSRRSREETHRLLSASRRGLSPNSLNGLLLIADKINTDDCT